MMGLRIKPGDASWSYSGFNDFRRRLASEEGFVLDEMDGYSARGWTPLARSWETVDSPLVPLLNHSDCDGYLSSYECEQMLPRLREIAAKWVTDQFANMDLHYDLAQLHNLIAGMEHSVLFGCWVVFS